jgi:ribose-phosphate pyrophosphokinase
MKNLRLFGMDGFEEFARKVAKNLGVSLTSRQEKTFVDGEPYIKSSVGREGNVRAADCYIINSLFSDNKQSVNDKFLKLLFFAGSLKDAGAARITLVVPYLAYQRQDRKTESRAGIYTSYSAKLLETMHCDRLITMDVHNLAATQSAMGMRVLFDNLEAKKPLADFVCGGYDKDGILIEDHVLNSLYQDFVVDKKNPDIVVLAPDSGGLGRAKRFRNELETRLDLSNRIPVVHLDKERKSTGELNEKSGEINGDIENKRIIIYDDIISSGGTIKLCCDAVKKYGGEIWAVCATHGIFTDKSNENLKDIPRLIVTDTVPPFRLIREQWKNKLYICKTTQLFAEAIRRTHYEGGSISELLD